MKQVYYLIDGPSYFRDSFKVGDYVIRVGTTIIDSNEVIRGFREMGRVVDIKPIVYKNRYIYLYYVQFYDRISHTPLYNRPIAVFGHDLVRYDSSKTLSYYYDLVKQWKNYSSTIPIVVSKIPGLKIQYSQYDGTAPLNNPNFGYSYSPSPSSPSIKDKRRSFKVGDRVIRKRTVYGSIGEDNYGVVISVYKDTKLPNDNKEHRQMCIINFKKELEQVVIPSSELDLVYEGKSKYVTIQSDKSEKDIIKISNKVALILGQSTRIDDRVAEDLLDFGSFTSNISIIKVDKDSFTQIKKICKELIE
uniref:Uncharacterized protein n=1 Tax=viral metagenome TaxID=1070528 RepID=A0A6C0AC83_9ZZZZ